MKAIKTIIKENSLYLVILTIVEIILSVICTMAFVYSDSLSYADSQIFTAIGIEKLLESIYSSTWWALILVILAIIAIFALASLIYKKMDYLFISICGWFVMLILAFNLAKPFIDNLSILALFIPIIIINIITYKQQSIKINSKKKKNKASK